MTWTRLDDQWDQSEKLIRADDALGCDSPSLMWARAVTYCNRTLSDGRIHGATLRTLVRHKKPQKVIDALVSTGALVKTGDDTFEVHDFLDWNDSRATVEDRRSKKQASGSKGGKQSGEVRRAKETGSEPPETPNQPPSKNEAAASPPLPDSLLAGSEKTNPSPSPSPLLLQEISETTTPPLQPERARERPGAVGVDSPDLATSPATSPSHASAILATLTRSSKLKSLATPDFAQRLTRFALDGFGQPDDAKLSELLLRLGTIDEVVADREAANEPVTSLAAFVTGRLKIPASPDPANRSPRRDARGGLQPFIEPGTWNPGSDR